MTNLFEKMMYRGLEYFGRYYAVYRGQVADNEDPENQDRLKLLVPKVADGILPTWAYPFGLYGGKGYGFHCLPEKGDTVWVQFHMGDPRFPVWSHGYYGTGEKPEIFNSPKVYGFISPKGHTTIIDDENNTIFIKHKDGNKLEITKDSVIINEGNLGALPIIQKLVSKLNDIETRVNTHQHTAPSGGGPTTPIPEVLPLPHTTIADIGNDKFKQ